MNELKCPNDRCGGLMGTGRPYVTMLQNVRTLGWKSMAHKEPDGHVFECAGCGCRVDIPSTQK